MRGFERLVDWELLQFDSRAPILIILPAIFREIRVCYQCCHSEHRRSPGLGGFLPDSRLLFQQRQRIIGRHDWCVLQAAFSPFLGVDLNSVISAPASLQTLVGSIPMRLLYGGITEEILLRWGVMAPIAWALWRVRNRGDRRRDTPSEHTIWIAIVASAVLFGVGHLPAAAMSYTLTLPLVAQIITLNAVVGIGFGWLFWKHSLETAMVAHIMFHVTLVTVSTVLIFVT